MNASRIASEFLARASACLGSLAAMLFLTGCGSADRDPSLAYYIVNLTPSQSPILVPDPAKTSASMDVELSVRCEGADLPPDCDKNVPNWKVRKPEGTSFLEARIADPTKPKTTATITLNIPAYLAAHSDETSLGSHWFQIGF